MAQQQDLIAQEVGVKLAHIDAVKGNIAFFSVVQTAGQFEHGAFTAADTAQNADFFARFAQWGRNRTMLLVTHRPQVLQIVNRIIVMDNGKVVMDGPRDLVLQKLMQNEQAKAANVKQQQQAAAVKQQQQQAAAAPQSAAK